MPADVVCVIDVSGSMGSAATFEGPDGSQINPQGLTLMDITKYACRAVAHMLQPGDRLGLVTFNTAGVIKTKLTEMTDAGKAKVSGDIEKVHFSAAVYCCCALLLCIAAVHCCCALLLCCAAAPTHSSLLLRLAVRCGEQFWTGAGCSCGTEAGPTSGMAS